jgi:uncharacterized membrane-anchored protein
MTTTITAKAVAAVVVVAVVTVTTTDTRIDMKEPAIAGFFLSVVVIAVRFYVALNPLLLCS